MRRLKDHHADRFQELLSSGLSLTATCAESSELGTFDLNSMSVSTVTPAHVPVSNDGQATSTVENAEDLTPAFTPDEETRFTRRYENSYDNADPRYMQ